MADVSVRPARAADADEIGQIQIDTWRTAYRTVVPAAALDALDLDAARQAWRSAIEDAPSPQHRVFVAQEQEWLVGFAAVSPADPAEAGLSIPTVTATVGPLLVEPRWGRRGHGSRLLAAIVDTAVSDGTRRLITWLPAGDTASLSFYRAAGWDVDGYARGLDTGAGEVREIRLHTALDERGDG